jgi:hypothetical protein
MPTTRHEGRLESHFIGSQGGVKEENWKELSRARLGKTPDREDLPVWEFVRKLDWMYCTTSPWLMGL